jgi:hypothetical protein
LQNGADFVPYLTASTDLLRRTHLQRALPSLDAVELDSLIGGVDHLFDSPFAPQVDAETLQAGPAMMPAKLPSLSDNFSDKAGPSTVQFDIDEAEENAESHDVKVRVEPRSVQGSFAGAGTDATRRTLRVAAPTGRISNQGDADPDRAADAEHWTGAFERANGRWPLAVAHLQGSGAFGCDYLSFDTEDARAAFEADPSMIELVNRFIETKSGSVWFTDNEWLAASSLGERYYVYRLAFVSGGRDQAELTIVRNPLSRTEAIKTARELVLDKVPDREEFNLVQTSATDPVLLTQEPVAVTNPEAAWTEA